MIDNPGPQKTRTKRRASAHRSADYEARKAKWIAEQIAAAPPLSDQQKVIIRGALLPVIRRQRGSAA